MFSDPLKLIPLAMTLIAGIGMWTGKMDSKDVLGILVAAGAIHSGISATNNVNPK